MKRFFRCALALASSTDAQKCFCTGGTKAEGPECIKQLPHDKVYGQGCSTCYEGYHLVTQTTGAPGRALMDETTVKTSTDDGTSTTATTSPQGWWSNGHYHTAITTSSTTSSTTLAPIEEPTEFKTCKKNRCSCKNGSAVPSRRGPSIDELCPEGKQTGLCARYVDKTQRDRYEARRLATPICDTDKANKCSYCFSGFTLNTTTFQCEPKQSFVTCSCPNGTPAGLYRWSMKCPKKDNHLCERCDRGFELQAGKCVWKPCPKGYTEQSKNGKPCCVANQCKCSNGIGMRGSLCPSNDSELCSGCFSGFSLLNGKCVAGCKAGYHYDVKKTRCEKNVCSCPNGTPRGTEETTPGGFTKTDLCHKNGAHSCLRCHDGYERNRDGRCVEPQLQTCKDDNPRYCDSRLQFECNSKNPKTKAMARRLCKQSCGMCGSNNPFAEVLGGDSGSCFGTNTRLVCKKAVQPNQCKELCEQDSSCTSYVIRPFSSPSSCSLVKNSGECQKANGWEDDESRPAPQTGGYQCYQKHLPEINQFSEIKLNGSSGKCYDGKKPLGTRCFPTNGRPYYCRGTRTAWLCDWYSVRNEPQCTKRCAQDVSCTAYNVYKRSDGQWRCQFLVTNPWTCPAGFRNHPPPSWNRISTTFSAYYQVKCHSKKESPYQVISNRDMQSYLDANKGPRGMVMV